MLVELDLPGNSIIRTSLHIIQNLQFHQVGIQFVAIRLTKYMENSSSGLSPTKTVYLCLVIGWSVASELVLVVSLLEVLTHIHHKY